MSAPTPEEIRVRLIEALDNANGQGVLDAYRDWICVGGSDSLSIVQEFGAAVAKLHAAEWLANSLRGRLLREEEDVEPAEVEAHLREMESLRAAQAALYQRWQAQRQNYVGGAE